jgi:predicted nucleotidyltransferase
MKISKLNLEAYALAFVSFVLPKLKGIDEIILFGSSVREEADETSDVDLFFNSLEKENEAIIKKELVKFYKSKVAEVFFLKGIKNPINVLVGNLNKWKLKRSIISEGIVLFGKYKSFPENLEGFVLVSIAPIKDITKRNKIIRFLFGREEKTYSKKGLIQELNGKKISPNVFTVPINHSKEIVSFLNKEKIDFNIFEFWSDEL